MPRRVIDMIRCDLWSVWWVPWRLRVRNKRRMRTDCVGSRALAVCVVRCESSGRERTWLSGIDPRSAAVTRASEPRARCGAHASAGSSSHPARARVSSRGCSNWGTGVTYIRCSTKRGRGRGNAEAQDDDASRTILIHPDGHGVKQGKKWAPPPPPAPYYCLIVFPIVSHTISEKNAKPLLGAGSPQEKCREGNVFRS